MEIIEIINNLKEIIEKNSKNDDISNTFLFIKDEIERNEIKFKVDHNINLVLNGMCFSTNESEEKSIIYGKKYLDTYSIKSSFHYSILIHEFKHIYDYSNNKNTFLNSRKKHFKYMNFMH